MDKKGSKKNLLLAVGLILCGGAMLLFAWDYLRPSQYGNIRENILIQIPSEELPEDVLYITPDRKAYKQGDMRLIIPALEIDVSIGENTTDGILKKMPGLYEFAQLPNEGNVNVSIAGHRDIYGMEFYYLDKLKTGNYLYLVLDQWVFRYDYLDSKIVSPDEWSVIKPQGFSCLTLTTCDPVGTSLNRLIIRGQLKDIAQYKDGFAFAQSAT